MSRTNGSVGWLAAELLVIVLGILLAYQADSWRESHQNAETARQGLVRMVAALDSAARQDSLFVARADDRAGAARQLVAGLRSGSLGDSAVSELFGSTIFRRTYEPSSLASFAGLRDTGTLGLVADDDLVVMLSDFHDGRLAYVDELMEMLDEIDASLRQASLQHLAPIGGDDGRYSWVLLGPVEGLAADATLVSTVAWAGYMTGFVAARVDETRAMNRVLQDSIRSALQEGRSSGSRR